MNAPDIVLPAPTGAHGEAEADPRKIVFTPDSTLEEFWASRRFYQFVIGPLGSTKTTNCIMKMLTYARMQQPGIDKVRRTRFVIARPTLPQIKTTVLQDILTWLRPILRYKVQDNKIEIRVGDVESDWYLIPLENIEDQRRLLSMQLSGVYLNEFRETPLHLMTAAAGRVGRFPRKQDGGCTNPFVMGDSNPPNEGGDWYKFLELDQPVDPRTGQNLLTYTHQPSGMSELATWREHLPTGYYERLLKGHDETWVNVHVHSKWGPDLAGEAVFRSSFVPSFHTRKGLIVTPGSPLLLGGDWGRTPAVLFGQVDPRGRLLVFKELTGENMNVELFISDTVKPELAGERWLGMRTFLVGDPSGAFKSDRSEESIFDILERLGIAAIPAPTNDIDPRLRAVEGRFLQAVGGEAGILIDPEGCPLLLRALTHEYRYKRRKTGVVDDIPDKTHPWSDLVDALQYLCLGVDTNCVDRATRREWRRLQRAKRNGEGTGTGGGGSGLGGNGSWGPGGGGKITPAGWT